MPAVRSSPGFSRSSRAPVENYHGDRNSVVHNNDTYGVLKLVLRPHSADYHFVRDPTSGLFSDSGTVSCH